MVAVGYGTDKNGIDFWVIQINNFQKYNLIYANNDELIKEVLILF